MWSNRPPIGLSTFIVATFGAISMIVAAGWLKIPDRPKHACVDTMTKVDSELQYADCDSDKSIGYLRDLGGERYVICRCRQDANPSNVIEPPERPDVIEDDTSQDEQEPEHLTTDNPPISL